MKTQDKNNFHVTNALLSSGLVGDRIEQVTIPKRDRINTQTKIDFFINAALLVFGYTFITSMTLELVKNLEMFLCIVFFFIIVPTFWSIYEVIHYSSRAWILVFRLVCILFGILIGAII